MKKSVVLIITVIYILAVIMVGQMIKVQVYDPIKYVEQIQIENDEFEYYAEDNPNSKNFLGYISLDYKEGLTYELKCRAFPYTSSNTVLGYTFEANPNTYEATITKDNSLIINFKKRGHIAVTVKALDGSGVQVKIYIEAAKDII